MERIDELNQRLAEIQDELLELGTEEFARKNQLHVERDQLRAEAANYREDPDLARPSSDLIHELKQRRSQLDSIARKHINPAKQADAGFSGAGAYNGPADAQAINNRIDEGSGRARVERRIVRLETILKKRGHL